MIRFMWISLRATLSVALALLSLLMLCLWPMVIVVVGYLLHLHWLMWVGASVQLLWLLITEAHKHTTAAMQSIFKMITES